MSTVHFAFDNANENQGSADNTEENISLHMQSMSAAGTDDFETILSEYPDISKLYDLVTHGIDNLSKQDQPSQEEIKVIKDGIHRLLQNISSLKVPVADRLSLTELTSSEASFDDDETKNFNDDVSSLCQIRDQLLIANRVQRQKADEEKSNLATINANLNDQLKEANSEIKIKENVIARLENQLKESTKDAENLNNEINELRDKLSQKEELIEHEKDANEELNNRINNLQLQVIQMEVKNVNEESQNQQKVGSKSPEQYEAEIERLNETIKELNNILDKQTQQLVESTELENKLSREINEAKEKYQNEKNEKEKVTKEVNKIMKQIEDLRRGQRTLVEENNEIREKHSKVDNELEELKTITNQIVLSANRIRETELSEIPDLIDELSKIKTDEELVEENDKLIALVDTLTRFFDASKEGAKEMGLIILDKKQPLLEDDEIRVELEKRINSTRALVKASHDKASEFNQIFGNERLTEETINKIQAGKSPDEYATVFVLSGMIQQLKNELENKKKLIEPLRRLMPQKYANADIFEAVADYFGKLEPIIEELYLTVNSVSEKKKDIEKGGEKIDLLKAYVRTSASCISGVLGVMRQVSSFCGQINELPPFLKTFVCDLQNEARKAKETAEAIKAEMSRSIQSMQTSKEAKEETMNVVKQQYQSKINSMQEKLSAANREIEHLKDKVESDSDEKRQLDNTTNALNIKIDEHESTISSLRNENARLRTMLAERTESLQNRLNEALNTSEEHHMNELKRIETKKNEQIATLNAQLQNKTKKLDKAKQQAKDMQGVLQKSIDTQRESIKMLIKQNKDLTERLANTESNKVLEQKIRDLEQKLQEANTAKYQLAVQVNKDQSIKVDQELVNKIGDKLTNSGNKMPDGGWTTKNIVTEVGRVAEKLRLTQLSTSSVTRIRTMTASIEEWNNWAKQLVSNIDDSVNVNEMSTDEMRSIIKDSAKLNKQKAKSIEILQSLRTQNALLKAGVSADNNMNKLQATQVGSVAYAVLFISIAKHKAQLTRAREMLQ